MQISWIGSQKVIEELDFSATLVAWERLWQRFLCRAIITNFAYKSLSLKITNIDKRLSGTLDCTNQQNSHWVGASVSTCERRFNLFECPSWSPKLIDGTTTLASCIQKCMWTVCDLQILWLGMTCKNYASPLNAAKLRHLGASLQICVRNSSYQWGYRCTSQCLDLLVTKPIGKSRGLLLTAYVSIPILAGTM